MKSFASHEYHRYLYKMVPVTPKTILKYYCTLKSIEGNGSSKCVSKHLWFSAEPHDSMLFLTKRRQKMCYGTQHNDTKHKGLI